MAWCISAFGREEMARIAVEEWAASSPVYTRRMQRALGYAPEAEGHGDVATIFKGLQLDIGAPPQFMDFRYTVHDPRHGEFHLDHCGALMDVEPLGPDYVRSMCHDIEDPTFDATAAASNPKAQVRPIHRPPRSSPDQHPHCAWTVTIDEAHPEPAPIPALAHLAASRAATLELAPIEPHDGGQGGQTDYAGPLVSDLDFSAFSHSALVRVADEVCLQMHLLDLGFLEALKARAATSVEPVGTIATKQLVGIAGVAAERISRALGTDALQTLRLHPLLNPAAYVDATFTGDSVSVSGSPAHEDGGWISLCGPGSVRPLQAAVRGVDPHLDVEVTGTGTDWTATVVRRDEPAPVFDEVAVTRVSTGAGFRFRPRRSLPITPV
jgi:hypothetical protein